MASATAHFNIEGNLLGLEITTSVEENNLFKEKESLIIDLIVSDTGTFPILDILQGPLPLHDYLTFNSNGEIEDEYNMDNNYDYNKVVISAFDLNEKHIQGWFESSYIIKSPSSGINPDTIIFWDCHFNAFGPE